MLPLTTTGLTQLMETARRERVRPHTFALLALLLPLNAYWVGWMEAVKWTGHPTTYSLYFNTVLLLLLLFALTELVRKFTGWVILNRSELLVLYFGLGVGSALVGHDQSQVLLSVIGHVHYFKSPTNRYEELLIPLLPSWLIVTDEPALRAMYIGNSSVWQWQNFVAWLKPLSWWWLFWGAMLAAFLGMSVLLIPRWVRHEKLGFPLARFPLYLTDRSLYASRLFWAGFAVPAFVNTLNNLHVVVSPAFPMMHTHRVDLGQFVINFPWNAIGWTPLNFFPFAIGIGFLLPLDLLFSSWFFYLVWKAQRVVVAALGYPTGGFGNPPYPHEQSFGAYMGLAALLLWTARHYLADTLKNSWRNDANASFIISPRWAWLLTVGGFIVLVVFSVAAKAQWWAALLFFIGYFGISLTVSRVRGEFGSPVHDLHFASPGLVMVQLVGTRPFTPQTLSVFTLYYWFNRAHRSHPMPTAMEGLVIGEQLRQEKAMWRAMWLSLLIGIPAACYALLVPYYRLGADTAQVGGAQRWFGWEAYNRYLLPWLTTGQKLNLGAIGFTFGGFLFVWLLHLLRAYWIGCPFHPVGYAISGTWSMEMAWFPLFLAWLAKALVLRYGTFRDYYNYSQFFIGLVIGDFVSGGLWNIYGTLVGREVYRFNE